MSSFVCSNKHFKELRQKTYDLILADRYILLEFNLDYHLDKEEIKHFVNNNIYDLYKLNVASVNLQYREKQVNRVCEDYDNNIGGVDSILDRNFNTMLSKNDLLGLYNAYTCLNYQIELSYDKKFVDIIQKHIAKNIIRELTDNDLNDTFNHWEYK